MSKHTPGPWFIDDHRVMANAGGDSSQSLIVIADPHFRSKLSFEEREANARLIAAAPDLLEALRGMFALVGDRAPEWDDVRIDAAVAAIAKAEGQP